MECKSHDNFKEGKKYCQKVSHYTKNYHQLVLVYCLLNVVSAFFLSSPFNLLPKTQETTI